jgi:predicted DNA-binding transcriptional regulator AlpA
MLLTASQAAKLLQVSEKTLWNHTKPRGNQIPAVRFGKTLRYSRESIGRWIDEQQAAPVDGGTLPPQNSRKNLHDGGDGH